MLLYRPQFAQLRICAVRYPKMLQLQVMSKSGMNYALRLYRPQFAQLRIYAARDPKMLQVHVKVEAWNGPVSTVLPPTLRSNANFCSTRHQTALLEVQVNIETCKRLASQDCNDIFKSCPKTKSCWQYDWMKTEEVRQWRFPWEVWMDWTGWRQTSEKDVSAGRRCLDSDLSYIGASDMAICEKTSRCSSHLFELGQRPEA